MTYFDNSSIDVMHNDVFLVCVLLPACLTRIVIANDYKYLQCILVVVVTQCNKMSLCIRSIVWLRHHMTSKIITPTTILFVVAIVALSAANMDRGSMVSVTAPDWLPDSGSTMPCSYVVFFLPDFLSTADWNELSFV